MKWDPGDDPDKKHRRCFPNCNFYNHPYIADGTLFTFFLHKLYSLYMVM